MTKIDSICEKIINHPISEEKKLEWFIQIILNCFHDDEETIHDLLTDFNNQKSRDFLNKLKNKKGLNTVFDDYGDITIVPTQESKNLACNNSTEFEIQCLSLLESQDSDVAKGILFEEIVQYLFNKLNIHTKTTKITGDNGVDLIGYGDSILPLKVKPLYFIQCKYYSHSPDINLIKKVASDVLFNIFDTSNEITHPIIPVIICNKKISEENLSYAKQNGIQYLTFTELIEICAHSMKLDFQELETLLKEQQ